MFWSASNYFDMSSEIKLKLRFRLLWNAFENNLTCHLKMMKRILKFWNAYQFVFVIHNNVSKKIARRFNGISFPYHRRVLVMKCLNTVLSFFPWEVTYNIDNFDLIKSNILQHLQTFYKTVSVNMADVTAESLQE